MLLALISLSFIAARLFVFADVAARTTVTLSQEEARTTSPITAIDSLYGLNRRATSSSVIWGETCGFWNGNSEATAGICNWQYFVDPRSNTYSSAWCDSTNVPPTSFFAVATSTEAFTIETQTTRIDAGIPTSSSASDTTSANTGAIVGGVLAGVSVCAVCLAVLIWKRYRKVKDRAAAPAQPSFRVLGSNMPHTNIDGNGVTAASSGMTPAQYSSAAISRTMSPSDNREMLQHDGEYQAYKPPRYHSVAASSDTLHRSESVPSATFGQMSSLHSGSVNHRTQGLLSSPQALSEVHGYSASSPPTTPTPSEGRSNGGQRFSELDASPTIGLQSGPVPDWKQIS
ncbi:hypothetical protein LTR64_004836 [Lithohypha guttulata]|uniref:uncharacterized protein n=1 Tax=Lithohypha guttulata TaxID=1690604 RepID=UPI002DDE08E4|nr:hypothetical protein LTR51_005329 [Lithohypha guttulata]